MLSDAASSKMLDIDFARQNKYFQRSTKSIDFFYSTKQVLQALFSSQTSRKPTFERWLFWLDETRTSSAFSFSGTTNTVVSASWCTFCAGFIFRSTKQVVLASKMLDIDFDRQNKYFQRSPKSLDFVGSTKQVLQALFSPQTSRKPAFERWLFWLDETRSSSAFSFSSTTNTVISSPWCISLDKYNTFGPASAQLEASERRNHYVCSFKGFSLARTICCRAGAKIALDHSYFCDAQKHLFHGDRRLPALVFIQNTQTNCTGRIDVRMKDNRNKFTLWWFARILV